MNPVPCRTPSYRIHSRWSGSRTVPVSVLSSAFLLPLQAFAHGDPIVAGDRLWLQLFLSVDWTSAVLLFALGAVYIAGLRRLGPRSPRPARRLMYAIGWAVLALALLPPVDSMGGTLFSAHMVQHELMMLLAAPLLIWSRPAAVLLWGCPQVIRRMLARAGKRGSWIRARNFLLLPPAAWGLHALALWGWHIPALFELSLSNEWVHTLQHLSFFGSALLFWAACAGRMRELATAVLLLTTALHASMLGALLTFSAEVWYRSYLATAPVWGMTALQDQQLGGLIMWVPGGLVFILMSMYSLMQLFDGRDREGQDESVRPSPLPCGAAGARPDLR
jgi:putative membrane protein